MNIDDVSMTACPACKKVGRLFIEYRSEFVPKKLGTWSLAGTTDKAVGTFVDWPYLVCGACGIEGRGKYE